MKMDTRNHHSFEGEWSCQATPMDVLKHLSQEALRIAGDALPIAPPGSPTFSTQSFDAPPRHRRAHSEVVTSFHSRSNSSGNLEKWKSQMQKALNWGSRSFREVNHYTSFDPEILANQKRQWYKLKPKRVDPERYKEPSALFEHFVVVGLHPDAKLEDVEDAFIRSKKWEQEMKRTERLDSNTRCQRPTCPTLEPEVRFDDQVLFQYPPGKKRGLQLKDLSSFCFPEGVKANVLERTPSLSDLNELAYGQEYLHRDDLSFIFSLKAADNTPLYGVCLHVQEVVQKPPVVYGGLSLSQSQFRHNSRVLVSAPRCYCILTRVPFFELHYEMLNSIIAQERLNRITKFVKDISLKDNTPLLCISKNQINEKIDAPGAESAADWMSSAIPVDGVGPFAAEAVGIISGGGALELHSPGSAASGRPDHCQMRELNNDGNKNLPTVDESTSENSESQSSSDQTSDVCHTNQSSACRSFESLFCPARSMSLEAEDNNDKGFTDDMIMKWARETKNDMLQIICGYHCMHIPERGSKIVFQPLEHLQGIEYQRPSISVLGLDEKYIDHKLSEEALQVKLKLAAAEESVALSLWSTATICRVLSLENILALVTGVLLEKQMIVQCSNLGVLSAVVLSLHPIIRPFEWQSLFLPILPERMLDFLDAPVPFIVGVQHKPADLKTRASNLVQVNVSENELKSCALPPLPRRYELIAQLRPIHSKLSCEDSIAQKHPMYKCSLVQAEAATQFLCVMRWYMESLCSDLRPHTITSVQARDKVSILLKDSFIESFPTREQYFVKLFVETQLFTVLSDARLSSYENE